MSDKKQTASSTNTESSVKETLAKPKDANLKNIDKAGYHGLAWYGLLGAVILLAWSLIGTIFTEATHMGGWELLFNVPGVIIGGLYAVLGIFAMVKVVKKQEGKYWMVFAFAALCAVLSPLGWFPIGGLVLAVIAGGAFFTWILLEKQ